MTPFSGEAFVAVLALIGVVIVASSLMSGWVQRAHLPQVGVFLLLGLAIGPQGLGWMEIGLDSPILRVVSTLGLALVLFSDAVTLDLSEVRQQGKLATLILGPGTILAAAIMAAAAHFLLGLGWLQAAIVAAAIASTDPVMLRGLLRRNDLDPAARQGLRLESSLNDVVLLPILLIAMAFAGSAHGGKEPNLGAMLLNLFVLGPMLGLLVGWVAIVALRTARARLGVRRDYESIYSLGVCFTAFAAAESLHASGFLACFAAGAVIAALDPELCDCFVEYGETTAEMLLMFTFVLLGGSLIWTGLQGLDLALILFVAITLLARPAALAVALARYPLEPSARRILVWFGPRGLSTLLLILLAVFGDAPEAERLFRVCCLAVLASVILHGGALMSFGRKHDRQAQEDELLVLPSALRERIAAGEPVVLADVRSHRAFDQSKDVLIGAVRLDPDAPVESATRQELAKQGWIALFCT